MEFSHQLNKRIHAAAMQVRMRHKDICTLCSQSGTGYEFLDQGKALQLLIFLQKKKRQNLFWDRTEERFISRSVALARLKAKPMQMSPPVNTAIRKLANKKGIAVNDIYNLASKLFQKGYKELASHEGWQLYYVLDNQPEIAKKIGKAFRADESQKLKKKYNINFKGGII